MIRVAGSVHTDDESSVNGVFVKIVQLDRHERELGGDSTRVQGESGYSRFVIRARGATHLRVYAAASGYHEANAETLLPDGTEDVVQNLLLRR